MTAAEVHPLSIPDYRYFWLSRFMAVLATMGMVVVIGYQAYDIARSDYGMSIREASLQLGLLGLFQFIPLALLTPVAGWAADRWERRTVARVANCIDMLVALTLGWFTLHDMLTLPLLFGFAALHGVARVFVGPAMSAIAPNIVPAASLPRAIALSSIAWQVGSVIGPASGGLLFAGNPSSPYWVSAGLLLLATISLSFVKPVFPPPMERKIHPVRQMIDGIKYTWSERFLLGAITLDLFAVLLAGATALLPVYARDILQVGPDGLGQLRAAPAVGASLVALLLTLRPLRHNVGSKMLWAVVIFGLATIGFGFSHEIGARVFGNGRIDWLNMGAGMAVALVMLVILGASDMLSVYVRSSLVQLNTPDDMRGRVSSVSGLAISASNELGELQSGVAAALLGPVGAVVFGGAGAIMVTGLWAWLFPELKNARTFEPQYRGKSP
ncbi:MFS transporter [Sphingorhabdus sp. IMCC26285]|jgi:MFS family permease|uniref:MFS transporter n=1 Tax=Sphingorhabdus profundilacus TaxID=2509718 RepID=A0A6I4LUW2_9SPHN|nr:MFS transporter [Sphingorhabdus profundilacus]MVZ96811.1 MFS transporter [Sphingorhabdus profundilacus]